jgi:hypothetical protein
MPTRNLDPWREALLSELRTRDLTGDRVEDLLAKVDAHCADTGKSPQEAFGDPVVYAHIFAPGLQPVKFVPAAVQGICGIAGLITLAAGVLAVMNESAAFIRTGAVVSFGAGTVVLLVFLAVTRHLAVSAGALLLGALALIVPYFLLPEVVFELPVWRTVTIGLLLLSTSWAISVYPDHVIETGARRRQILATRWGLPAMMACAVLLSWTR